MLKAVLKKSREGGKGSKKEPGMCTGRSWVSKPGGCGSRTPAQAGPMSLPWAQIREVICVGADCVLEL